MPANQKYLSSSWQRVLKISAGVIGGYLLSVTIHLALALIPGIGVNLLVSGIFSVFLLWIGLMIIAFLFRNGWIVWAVYLSAALITGFIAYKGGITL